MYIYKISKIGRVKFEEVKRKAKREYRLNEFIKIYCGKDYSVIE